MNRRLLLALFALVPMLLSGYATAGDKDKVDESKIGKLAASAGITSEQAQATVGSLLRLSQGRLETSQYDPIVQQHQPKTYSYTGQRGALAGGTAGSLQARTLAGAGGAVAGGSADVTAITPITGTATSKSAAPSTYAYQAKAGGSTGKPQLEF